MDIKNLLIQMLDREKALYRLLVSLGDSHEYLRKAQDIGGMFEEHATEKVMEEMTKVRGKLDMLWEFIALLKALEIKMQEGEKANE
jgi:hypothetical protein